MMNIERTSAYDGSVMPHDPNKPARTLQGLGASNASDGADTVAQSEFQALTIQAADAPEINAKAVAEAKQLIQSGQLSSPESIRRAAEAMISRGI
jgi:hypothetical protein